MLVGLKMKAEIPNKIKKHFPDPGNSKMEGFFEVSVFEDLLLQDIYQNDESSTQKLKTDVSKQFIEEIRLYQKQKRNIRISTKGETRDGKSLSMLRVCDLIIDRTPQDFAEEVEKIVCGNQVEYRKKLKEAEFQETYLVDENFFTRSGLGANIEASQLKDFNAIIAKKNVSVIYINPERFLSVGANIGLATYGRNSEHWLSRLLLYRFKDGYPFLIGYIVLDVGELFRKHGCFVYKDIKGCNNLEKKKSHEVPKELVEASSCLSDVESNKDKLIDDGSVCPFYNLCKHPVCRYEKKKDSWIDEQMEGGHDERTKERIEVSCKIIKDLYCEVVEEKRLIKMNVKNKNALSSKLTLFLPKYTNSKLGIREKEELIDTIMTYCEVDTLKEALIITGDEQLIQEYLELPDQTGILHESLSGLIKDKEK